jgi:hypothetical protein
MLKDFIEPVADLLGKFVPDQTEKLKLAHEIATLTEKQAHAIAIAQIEVNKVEAASNSIFKSGWRPAIGWVCGFAFAYHFVIQPLLVFILTYAGHPVPELPEFDMASLMTVLGGLLGLGSLRTFEKYKGVTK